MNRGRMCGIVAMLVALAVAGLPAWATWNENKPAGTDLPSEFPTLMRADKATLRVGLDAEHIFNAGSQSGMHKEGGARIWIGTESQKLTPITHAFTSSTTGLGRLFYATDAYTLYYGGPNSTWLQLFPKGRVNIGTAAAVSGVTAVEGRIYLATDTEAIYYGSSATPSVWTVLHTKPAVSTCYYAWASGAPTTTSSTFVAISAVADQLKKTLTTTGGGLRIEAVVTASNSSAYKFVYYSLEVDGANVTSEANGLAMLYHQDVVGAAETVTVLYQTAALSAGEHVVRVLWRTSGGTESIKTAIVQSLIVTEQ